MAIAGKKDPKTAFGRLDQNFLPTISSRQFLRVGKKVSSLSSPLLFRGEEFRRIKRHAIPGMKKKLAGPSQ